MSKRFGLARRGAAVVLVFALAAPLFAVLALSSGAPAGAVGARPATHRAAAARAAAFSAKKKPAKKKAVKKKTAKKSVKVAKGHLSSRDYVEVALLALSPFVIVGLFLVVSESRRRKPALAES